MGSYLGSEPRRRLEKSSEVGHGEAMPARVVAPRRAQPCRVLWEAAQSGPESWGRDPHLPPPVFQAGPPAHPAPSRQSHRGGGLWAGSTRGRKEGPVGAGAPSAGHSAGTPWTFRTTCLMTT